MNKPKPPSIIPLLVLTLIMVVMWVSFDIYRSFQKPTDVHVPESVLQPLTPTLDQTTVDQIEKRIYLDDSQIPDSVATAKHTADSAITGDSAASPAAQPVASDSGTTQ